MENGTPKKRKTWRRSFLLGCMLSAILLPILAAGIIYGLYRHNQARTARLNATVQSDLDSLSTAVQEYHAVNGQYPQSLDQLLAPIALIDKVPVDPFSPHRESYKYMDLNKSSLVFVYSVGDDEEDNSGFNDILRIVHPNAPFDITFLCQNLQIERTKSDPDNAMAMFMECEQVLDIDTTVMPWQKMSTVMDLGWQKSLELLKYANRDPQSDMQSPIPDADEYAKSWLPQNATPTLDDVQEYLNSMQPIMEMIHRAAQKPKVEAVYNDLEYCSGLGGLTFPLRRQLLAKIIASQGRYYDYLGEREKALSTYCDGIWLGQVIAYNNPLTEELINCSVKGMCCRSMQDSLQEYEYTENELVSIIHRLEELDSMDVRVEEVFQRHALMISHARKHWSLSKSFTMAAAEVTAQRGVATLPFIIPGVPPPRKPGAMDVCSIYINNVMVTPASLRRLENRFSVMATRNSYGEVIRYERQDRAESITTRVGKDWDYFEFPLVRVVNARSSVTATRLIAALKLHKLRHGAYPEKLEDLSGIINPVPTDPFTGKMFEYAKTGDSFTLYTPGPELEDNGGLIEYDPTNGILSAGDITFGPR